MNEAHLKLLPVGMRKRQENLLSKAGAANVAQVTGPDADEQQIQDEWVKTYTAGKKTTFAFEDYDEKGNLQEYTGYAEFPNLRLVQLRAGRRPVSKDDPNGEKVLTLDMRINSIGETIGIIVDGESIPLAPYSDPSPIFSEWRSRPHAISAQCFRASPHASEMLQRILVALPPLQGTDETRVSINKNPRLRSQYRDDGKAREPWLYVVNFPMPKFVEGPLKGQNNFNLRGIPLKAIDIAVPPDLDDEGKPKQYNNPELDAPFKSFYHGVMAAVEALLDTATDNEADEAEQQETRGVQFSLTGRERDFSGIGGRQVTSHKRVTITRLELNVKSGNNPNAGVINLRSGDGTVMTAAEQQKRIEAPPLPPKPVEQQQANGGQPGTPADYADFDFG